MDFVHLHVHSDYSLLDGASSIQKLVSTAKKLGQPALALTDHGNMFGVLRFQEECKKQEIKPLIGCELYVAAKSRFDRNKQINGRNYYHLILIAKNEIGYRNLIVLSSKAYTEGMYYKPRIDDELLQAHSEGLICLSACLAGQLPYLLLNGRKEEAEAHVRKYLDIFGDNYFIEVQNHGLAEQKKVTPLLIEMARKLGIPMVLTNDVHYAEQKDSVAQDILLCIGMKKVRTDTNRMKFETDQFYLKSAEEMAKLFPEYPEMMSNTLRIADMCNVEIPQPGPLLPVYKIPEEFASKDLYIRHLVAEGLKTRYEVITDEIKKRAEYELDIIIKMDFVGYFLIVWDFINWAKNHDIPVGPGRGSGAGSIVAYAMRITDIDPLRYKLLFERFLNPERISMPDFDVDFCFERRQEVIEYVRQKYGDESVGQIITFGTLKPKAAIKDVGRVLNIPLADVNMITKLMPEDPKLTFEKALTIPELVQIKETPEYTELFQIAEALEDSNRNTSLHAAGIVIGKTKLTDYVPLYKDSKTGKIATQFTMDLIEQCGLVKMDFLGLKTLTLIKHTEDLIRRRGGALANFSIQNICDDDERTYKMLGEGMSAAVFQFESKGMQGILKRAKPDKIEDLIALNALYRPGPMAFIDQFIESKFDNSKIKYPDPCLQDILEETYGVIVYQEQVMQVAQKIGGLSLGEADILRRAMGKKKKEVMAEWKVKFAERAVTQGFDKKHAEEIFDILVPFAGYGFNKSHAAAYSVLAYQTAYLKANFPAEFMAANLTNEITSVDKLPVYIEEAEKMGLTIVPPSINKSEPYFSVDKGEIIFGFLGIKGVGEQAAIDIYNERKANGMYKSFIDFLDRVDLHTVKKSTVEVLIKTGCFDEFDINRATLIGQYEAAMGYAAQKKEGQESGQASLFENTGIKEFSDFVFARVEDLPQKEKLRMEKDLVGFYISGHPLDEYRKIIETTATLDLGHLERATPEKKYLIVGMLNAIKPYTTKKGQSMAFGSFEDLHGVIDLVFFSKIWEEQRARFLPETVMGLIGTVDTNREEPSFLVDSYISLDELEEKSIKEVHVEVASLSMSTDKQFQHLRDFLLGAENGTCDVFIHIAIEDKIYIVQASSQVKVSSDDNFLSALGEQPGVLQVWKE
ncbi:DNA polymerase III subunit alpha [Treponema phagedenis]|uniref:DNA polymerase III subunit alpha n=1 Tax=Treponema phagedenis TaxID=162 RepID=UPI001980E10A|nr:DNA polymerase III subunit alpha [Treponema phagedenis]QSH93498.1 DNA polymerase III subunit alpha [Treponema phagedenis]